VSARVDSAPLAASSVVRPLAPALLRYAMVCVPALGLAAFALRALYTAPDAQRAVMVSLWIALPLQLVTFAIARLVSAEQIVVAWGIGMLMRFAVLAAYGFIGIGALQLASGPALISLAVFFFVSTLLEPLFLKS
jgi:hypothetical protein